MHFEVRWRERKKERKRDEEGGMEGEK